MVKEMKLYWRQLRHELHNARDATLMLAIIAGFADMRRSGRTEARRLRDLAPDLVRKIVEQAALDPVGLRQMRDAVFGESE